MTIDEAIAHAREKAKEKRKEMQCKTCKLFVRSDLHSLQGYCHKNEFRSIEIDSWQKVCSEYVPKEMCKCAEEHEQLAEWLEELKFLRQWKSDVMDDFCRYDVGSFEELVTNARNKAIDDIKEKLMQNGFIYTQHALDVFNEIAEQLKAGGKE